MKPDLEIIKHNLSEYKEVRSLFDKYGFKLDNDDLFPSYFNNILPFRIFYMSMFSDEDFKYLSGEKNTSFKEIQKIFLDYYLNRVDFATPPVGTFETEAQKDVKEKIYFFRKTKEKDFIEFLENKLHSHSFLFIVKGTLGSEDELISKIFAKYINYIFINDLSLSQGFDHEMIYLFSHEKMDPINKSKLIEKLKKIKNTESLIKEILEKVDNCSLVDLTYLKNNLIDQLNEINEYEFERIQKINTVL